MNLEKSIINIRKLDILGGRSSPVHNLDPRTKITTTLGFIIIVLSFEKYEIIRLVPLLIYPLSLVYAGDLSLSYLLKKVIIVSPFALFVAVWGPVTDHRVALHVFSIPITAGLISFTAIMLRFLLTVLASLVLIATTGFISLCYGLNRLKVPVVLSTQLLFLYRYLYVLAGEALRMIRAQHIRSYRNKMSFGTFKHILGGLLLRTIARAERIHTAMTARGFTGTLRIDKSLVFHKTDLVFFTGWMCFFILTRLLNLPFMLGKLFTAGTL